MSDRLKGLAFLALEDGLQVAQRAAHAFTPFLEAVDARGQRLHFGLDAGGLEPALELVDHIINDPRHGVEAYALALDCELEVGGRRMEGVRVEAGERGKGGGLVLVQRYRRRDGARRLETVGRPELWGLPEASRFSPVPVAFARCGFSTDEWQALYDAPLRAFLYVATASGAVGPRTREAFRQVLVTGLDLRSPLVGQVCGEALHQLDALGEAPLPPEASTLEPLRPLCPRVAERLGLGEASRFRRCLLDVGGRVASASSGLLGLLGLMGDPQRRALAALAEVLVLPPGC